MVRNPQNPATEEMRKARRQSGLVEPVALPEGATLELQPTKPPLPSPGTSAVEGLLADLDAIKVRAFVAVVVAAAGEENTARMLAVSRGSWARHVTMSMCF